MKNILSFNFKFTVSFFTLAMIAVSSWGISTSGSITGNTLICRGQYYVKYTMQPVPNATQYIFTAPLGSIIAANGQSSISQSGNVVYLNFSSTFIKGKLTAYAVTPAGATPSVSLTIYLSPFCDDSTAMSAVFHPKLPVFPGLLVENKESGTNFIFGELAYIQETRRKKIIS
jgi:hypothetical protein